MTSEPVAPVAPVAQPLQAAADRRGAGVDQRCHDEHAERDVDEQRQERAQLRVVVGGMLSISAACPAGTTSAIVMAGNEDANDPFIDEEVTPAADGSVSVTARVPATGQVPARPGAATAVVVCSDGSGFMPLAVGLTNVTVAPAAVAPAKTPTTTRAASATPQLANTGSDTAPWWPSRWRSSPQVAWRFGSPAGPSNP